MYKRIDFSSTPAFLLESAGIMQLCNVWGKVPFKHNVAIQKGLASLHLWGMWWRCKLLIVWSLKLIKYYIVA